MPQSELPKARQNPFAQQTAIQRTRYSTRWHLANVQRNWQANQEARLGTTVSLVRCPMWPKRRGELSELAFLQSRQPRLGVARPWGDNDRYDFT
jgi:hypothetical protein